MNQAHGLKTLVLLLCLLAFAAHGAPAPRVALADVYTPDMDVSKYWVSEKYDGVRGYWDGQRMRTRAGTVIDLPDWFTAGWPDHALDGELWAGRGRFSTASSIVRSADATDPRWRAITYQVFDLPEHPGGFTQRQAALKEQIAAIDQSWVHAVAQSRIDSPAALQARLKAVVAAGGEGLVLRRADMGYRAGRHAGLIKLKPFADAEARVIGINPGHGRLAGKMGSLKVRTPDGRVFAVGSGFSDAERADPPAPGDWITYRHTGQTATGLPRFPRFLRLRPGGPPPEIPPARPSD